MPALVGFAVVAFRFVVAGGQVNIDLLIGESKPEGHEIGITAGTLSVAGHTRCGAGLSKGTIIKVLRSELFQHRLRGMMIRSCC